MAKRSLKPAAPAPGVEFDVDELDEVDDDDLDRGNTADDGDDVDDDDLDDFDDEDEDDLDEDDDPVGMTKCLYCGCTEQRACQTDDGPCAWIPGDEPVCTARDCMTRHRAAGGEVPEDLLPLEPKPDRARDDRPIEEYLGARTMAGLPHKMRERSLAEQELSWLISTIGRITDEVIATRHGAGTREESEIARDLGVLIARAEWIGAAEQLSSGTRAFAAEVIARNTPPANADADADAEAGPEPDASSTDAPTPVAQPDALPGTLVEIALEDITPDPEQPRLDVDDELADSIRAQGVRQPIVVRLNPDADSATEYMIVDGERRYRGALKAGRTTIWARLQQDVGDPGDRLLAQLTYNDGKRLAPLEEAKAWKRIMEAKGWNAQQLAAAIGKPKSTIGDRLALLDAPKALLPYFESGFLTAAAGPVVRSLKDLPQRALDRVIDRTTTDFTWTDALTDFVVDRKPLRADQFEEVVQDAVDMELALVEPHVADVYKGKTVQVGKHSYAVDKAAYAAAAAKAQKPAAAKAPKTERSAADKKYAEEERKRREKQAAADKRAKEAREQKKQLYRAQYDAVAAKLPGAIDGKLALVLLAVVVEHLFMGDDEQLYSLGVPKGTGHLTRRIMGHAEKLDAKGRIQLLLKLAIFNDVPPYHAEDDYVALAAKAIGVDLKKVKAPDPAYAANAKAAAESAALKAAAKPAKKKPAKAKKGGKR